MNIGLFLLSLLWTSVHTFLSGHVCQFTVHLDIYICRTGFVIYRLYIVHTFCLSVCFETRAHCVAQADIGLPVILLPQAAKCWDYKHARPHPALYFTFWVTTAPLNFFSDCTTLHSHWQYMRIPVFIHPHQYFLVLLFLWSFCCSSSFSFW